MKKGSCKTGKPKRMRCELEYKVKNVYEHAPMNVIDSVCERK